MFCRVNEALSDGGASFKTVAIERNGGPHRRRCQVLLLLTEGTRRVVRLYRDLDADLRSSSIDGIRRIFDGRILTRDSLAGPFANLRQRSSPGFVPVGLRESPKLAVCFTLSR